jgi:hypothetical protein
MLSKTIVKEILIEILPLMWTPYCIMDAGDGWYDTTFYWTGFPGGSHNPLPPFTPYAAYMSGEWQMQQRIFFLPLSPSVYQRYPFYQW